VELAVEDAALDRPLAIVLDVFIEPVCSGRLHDPPALTNPSIDTGSRSGVTCTGLRIPCLRRPSYPAREWRGEAYATE
jgi:hypothetical protein